MAYPPPSITNPEEVILGKAPNWPTIVPNSGNPPGYKPINFPGDKPPGPTPPGWGVDNSWASDPNKMKAMQTADFNDAMKQMSGLFDTPQMQEIMGARHAAAFGPDSETALARASGQEGINRSLQTAMRQFQGALPSSGVRGGAAGAMGGILARSALDNTRGLERDLAINEMARRREALGNLEHSYTGERAGKIGGAFGMTALGSQNRSNALGYMTAQDFMKAAQAAVDKNGNGSSESEKNKNFFQKMAKAPEYFGDNNPFSKWIEGRFNPSGYSGGGMSDWTPGKWGGGAGGGII